MSCLSNIPLANSGFTRLARDWHWRSIKQSKISMEQRAAQPAVREIPRRHPLHLLKHLNTSPDLLHPLSFFTAVLTTQTALSSITTSLENHPQATPQPFSPPSDPPNQNTPQPNYRACPWCPGNKIMARNKMKFTSKRCNLYFHRKCSGFGARQVPTNWAWPTCKIPYPTFPYSSDSPSAN